MINRICGDVTNAYHHHLYGTSDRPTSAHPIAAGQEMGYDR